MGLAAQQIGGLIQMKSTAKPQSDGRLLIGFLMGFAIAIPVFYALYFFGPKQVYDQAVAELGERAIENARGVENCTRAYVASHGGQIPKGTLVRGEGVGLAVVGFDEAAR